MIRKINKKTVSPITFERFDHQNQGSKQDKHRDHFSRIVEGKLETFAILDRLGELLERVLLLHLGIENLPKVGHSLGGGARVVGGLQ